MGKNDSIAEEFPEFGDKIHKLKLENNHFHKLHDQFEVVSKAIARSEARIDLLSEIEEEKLRKERLKLKDEIYSLLVNSN
jgi:hypothetical protein